LQPFYDKKKASEMLDFRSFLSIYYDLNLGKL